jgi:integrase
VLKKQADAFLDTVRGQLASGTFVDLSAGRISLPDLMQRYADSKPYRHNTRVNIDWSIRKAREYFGDQPISTIKPTDLQTFVTSIDLEPRSVATVFQYVRSTFRSAYLDSIIGRDPTARVKLPRPDDSGKVTVPSVEDVLSLHDGASDEFAVAVTLGAGLGLRAAEVAGLTADRIDFLGRQVTVDRQWHGKLDQFAPVKYAASSRTIPASGRVLDELAFHLEEHGSGEHGVVIHANGRPLNSNRFDWRWEQTTKAADVVSTFHRLRHFYASSLISAGCSIVAVQHAVGHATASTTLDVYGHLMPSDTDRLRSAIDTAFENPEDSLRTAEAE